MAFVVVDFHRVSYRALLPQNPMVLSVEDFLHRIDIIFSFVYLYLSTTMTSSMYRLVLSIQYLMIPTTVISFE